MCFIKFTDPLSPCEHDECRKALEAFKGSNCMYNYPMQAKNNATSQYMNIKRNSPGSPQNYADISQEIRKKIKVDENFMNNENNDNMKNLMNSFPSLQNNSSNNLNFMVQSNNQSTPLNLLNNAFNKPQIYPQYNNYCNENLLNLQLRMNCNGNMQNMPISHASQKQEQSKNPTEFDRQIWASLVNQNTLLLEMKERTLGLTQIMGKMMQDFSDLQKTVSFLATEKKIETEVKKETDQQDSNNSSLTQSSYFTNTSEISQGEDLIRYLYVNKANNFKYQLVQGKKIDLPLYRERNFNFSVVLKDLNNKEIFHTNRIPLSIALYTYENPPKCIDSNTSGNKILKGYAEKDLVNGTCAFEKIQIKEVTSHFRKGKIFIVVYPKMPTFGNFSEDSNINPFIDYRSIKPLVIESVTVKAKKIPSFLKKLKKKEESERISSFCLSEKMSIFEDI